MVPESPESVAERLETAEGECVLTYDALDPAAIIASVADDAAGAQAVFIGTTRNSFNGKTVTRLEYQAYSKLAIKTMARILHDVRLTLSRSDHDSTLIRCAVYHRLGNVPVGEPSIVIAVSSPHRKEAFCACESILEQIKHKAQIWKREYYAGDQEEDAVWKASGAY